MKLKSSYDIIVVGSSPIMLIEAYFLSKIGNSILIIEKNKRPGGSWQTFSYKEFSNQLEVGCHVWYRDNKCLELLNNVFNLDIKAQKFQPKVYWKGFYFPYYLINFFVLTELIFSINSWQKLRSFKSIFICFVQDLFSKEKFQYPLSGSHGFVQNILEKIKQEGVEIIFNKEIIKIDIPNKNIILSDESKINYKNQVVMSIKSQINSIVDSNLNIHYYDFKISSVYNFYLIINKIENHTISYVGVWNDDVIYRVSDVSYNDVKLVKANNRILCVQVLESFYYSKCENKELIIIDKLIKMKIIKSHNEVNFYFWKKFDFNNQSNDLTKKMNDQFSPQLRYLNSHNLIKSFSENYLRWQNNLKND